MKAKIYVIAITLSLLLSGMLVVVGSESTDSVGDGHGAEETGEGTEGVRVEAEVQTGAQAQPEEIHDWLDLHMIRHELDGDYVLMSNLTEDSEGYDELVDTDRGWDPIGGDEAFTGTFDGNGYEISDLYIERPETSHVGLFCILDGEVSQVGLVDSEVNGFWAVDVGVLAGRNSGTITGSYATGDVSGTDYVGGLVGYNRGGTISESYADADVRRGKWVGGLVGDNDGTISGSYASGNVGGDSYVGGLVGDNDGTISDSYATGNVDGDSYLGGLVGRNQGYVENSHYNVDEVLINGGHHVTRGGLFDAQFQDWVEDRDLDIEDYRRTLFPSALEAHYEIISTEGMRHLLGFADRKEYTFRLGADVDLSDDPGMYVPYLAADFEGNGHKISDLYIDVPFAAPVGMFGDFSGGTITGTAVVDAEVKGYEYVGILLGRNSGTGTVSDSYATGEVEGRRDHVGGLVGYNGRGTVFNSHADGDVSGSTRIGGLMGHNSDGRVIGSYAAGEVDGLRNIGGLVGENNFIVTNSNAEGDVSGHDRVGGIVGSNTGTVSNSYAAGDVDGDESVGGLVGQNSERIRNCYAVGDVSGSSSIGGLVGLNSDTISSSYAIGRVSGNEYVGALVGYNRGGTVSTSYATGNVLGDDYLGALVGYNRDGVVEDTYGTGDVSGTRIVGGLVGLNGGEALVFDSYAEGEVSAINYVGGLVGLNGGEAFVSDSYAKGEVSGVSYVAGLIGENSGTMENSHYNVDEVLINGGHHITRGGLFDSQFRDWVEDRDLDIEDYSDTLVSSEGHYEISGVDGLGDLLGFAGDEEYKFRLTQDIDMSSEPGLYIPYLAAEFDGDNNTLSGLYLNMPFAARVGMFGYVSGGVVTDTAVVDAEVSGDSSVGSLIGRNSGTLSESYAARTDVSGEKDHVGGLIGHNGEDGEVSDSYAASDVDVDGDSNIGGLVGRNSGTVSASNAASKAGGNSNVGGLVGENNLIVNNSHAEGDVSGHDWVGGLVGSNTDTGTVSNSYATGAVEGDESVGGLVGQNSEKIRNCYAVGYVSGSSSIGGLVGLNSDTVSSSYTNGSVDGTNYVGALVGYNRGGNVSTSYTNDTVSGTYYVGGLVGYNQDGLVENTYTTGNVSGIRVVGGLVGLNGEDGVISASYARGNVSGDGEVGGLVGLNGEDGTVLNSFWDTETSGQNQSDGGTGKNTTEMKDVATYTDTDTEGLEEPWDFVGDPNDDDGDEDIWDIDEDGTVNDGYPFLTSEEEDGEPFLTKTSDGEISIYASESPPTYLGGLEDAVVGERDRWVIDLENYFDHPEDEELLYQSNKDEITIYNMSWAVWEPGERASDLRDVVFTARLLAYPELKTESDPIDLYFEEAPSVLRYLGGLSDTAVYPDETWSIDMVDHFTHEEGPERLGFNVTHDEIEIENKIASWTPEEVDEPLRDVVFTAYDLKNPELKVTSPPIDLGPPPEGTPAPVIESITPEDPREGEEIIFEGEADNSVGDLSYRWTSDIDGELSDEREFASTLSPGEHLILLEVKDRRGNWSEPTVARITVEEKEIGRLRLFFYSTEFQVGLSIVLIGLTLNFLGNYVLTGGSRPSNKARSDGGKISERSG